MVIVIEERDIVRQLAMRRIVFAFPRDLLAAILGNAAALLARDVVAGALAIDGIACYLLLLLHNDIPLVVVLGEEK